MKPALILVGAKKGGAGKTTIARALLDFFARVKMIQDPLTGGRGAQAAAQQ
jgi:tRNA A37 threonylcarbamoyladenosine biosynthesis protein TsaE